MTQYEIPNESKKKKSARIPIDKLHDFDGHPFKESAELAADFVRETVNDTFAAGTPVRNGVLLEKNLKRLFKA